MPSKHGKHSLLSTEILNCLGSVLGYSLQTVQGSMRNEPTPVAVIEHAPRTVAWATIRQFLPNCNRACSQNDLSNHKPLCNQRKAHIERQALVNISSFLQQAFYTYRLVSFDLRIKSTEQINDILEIHEDVYRPGDTLVDYPIERLTSFDAVDHKMLLTRAACDCSVAHFHPVLKVVLGDTGLVKKIEEVQVSTKYGPRAWRLHQGIGENKTVLHANDPAHMTLRLTLKNGSKWALDLTSAQFGYSQSLLPWSDYEKERVNKILHVQPFGAHYQGGLWVDFSDIRRRLMYLWNPTSKLIYDLQGDVARHLALAYRTWFEDLEANRPSPVTLFKGMSKEEFEKESLKLLMYGLSTMDNFRKNALLRRHAWL